MNDLIMFIPDFGYYSQLIYSTKIFIMLNTKLKWVVNSVVYGVDFICQMLF